MRRNCEGSRHSCPKVSRIFISAISTNTKHWHFDGGRRTYDRRRRRCRMGKESWRRLWPRSEFEPRRIQTDVLQKTLQVEGSCALCVRRAHCLYAAVVAGSAHSYTIALQSISNISCFTCISFFRFPISPSLLILIAIIIRLASRCFSLAVSTAGLVAAASAAIACSILIIGGVIAVIEMILYA